jgi:hypothetical protein
VSENESRERPKKSWREIDSSRNRSSQQTSTDRERERENKPKRGQRSTKSYKAALDRLFESGGIGKLLEERQADQAPAAPPADDTRAKLAAKVRDALDPDEVTAAVNRYLAKFGQPPDDFEFLGAMLRHRSDQRVSEAMQGLGGLLDRGERPRRPRTIAAHLRMIEEVGDDPDLVRGAADLRRRLG